MTKSDFSKFLSANLKFKTSDPIKNLAGKICNDVNALCEELFTMVDKNQDNKINFEEFTDAILKIPELVKALQIQEIYGVKAWDESFISLIYANIEKWSTSIKVLGKLVDKGETVTWKDVARKWKPIVREPQKSSFSEYIQFKLITQYENPKLNIKEDPYTAIIKVWDINDKLLVNKLTQKNSTDYDGDDGKLIFDNGMYGSGVFCVEHINYTQESYGLTFIEENVKVALRDEIQPFNMEEENDDEQCPI